MENITVSAIVPAGGVGSRFCKDTKKQFFEIDGKPVLYYTLKALSAYPFDEYIVGAPAEDHKYIKQIAGDIGITVMFAAAGVERSDTVLNCLRVSTSDYVAVHDAVRPFATKEIISNTISAALDKGGAICGIMARDTVKKVVDHQVVATLDRTNIFLVHTPQAFFRKDLLSSIERCLHEGIAITDDSSAFEYIGAVKICNSSVDNIKITESGDIELVRQLIKKYFG